MSPFLPSIRLVRRLAVCLCVLVGTLACADDWPQWRGPNRDAVWRESGIVATFPPEGLKTLWKVRVGTGFSSPCVVAGKVFLTDSEVTKTNVSERVHCFDAATGRAIWTHKYPANYPDYGRDPNHPFGPVATPVVTDGKIYTVGRAFDVVCLDARTGRVIWHRNLPKDFGATDDLRGFSCSPLVEGNLLIVPIAKSPKVSIVALNRDTGQQVWEALDEIPADTSPIVITSAGRRQLIVWAYQSVASLDPQNGEILWRQNVNTGQSYAVATPVWKDGRLLLGGLMLKLAPDEPGAEPLWPREMKPSLVYVSDTSTALIQNGLIFSPRIKGLLRCLDGETGQTKWEAGDVTERKAGASIHLTAVPSIGRVLLYTDRGDLVLAQLSAEAYREISRAHILDPTQEFGGRKMAWPPPAYAERCVFARSDAELDCVSLAAETPSARAP